MSRHFKTLCVVILGGVAALLPAGTWADAVLHARVSFDAGNSMVRGASDNDWSHATVNTLVLPGDTLWADEGGTSEIEFSGGSFLRMADGSKAEVSAIAPTPTVQGWEGSFYVQRVSRSTGDFIFVAPAATVQVEEDSAVRIDIVNQATTVTVRWGRAAVRTDVGSPVYVSAGERVWVDPGLLPSNPSPFDRNEEDGFDVWNRERAEALASGYQTVPTDVISEPVIGVSDLGNYGEWVHVDNRSYWRPTVVSNYVPYRYGHWSSVPSVGYTWVGHYPFSYTTSHYGRWNYFDSYGWCWSYDRAWAPAWAATVRVGDYLVWTPVDYYHRPVYGVGASFFSVGGVSFSMFSSSYAPISHLGLGPRYVYGVNSDISNYIFANNGDVHIWNININDRNHVRVPFERNLDQVRIYNPRRSIRGPLTVGADGVLASQRVRQLESRIGRDSFRAIDRTGRAGVRTDVTGAERAARVRNVRVSQEAPSYVRASSRNPENAAVAATRSLRVPRSRDIAGGEDLSTPRNMRGGATTPERGAAARERGEAVGGRTTEGRGVRETSGVERGRTSTPVERGVRGGTDREGRTSAGAERGQRSTVDGGVRTPAAGDRNVRGGTAAPGRTSGGVERGQRSTVDGAVRTPVPSGRGGDRPTLRAPQGSSAERGAIRGPEVRTSPNVERSARPRGTSEVTRTPVRSGPPSVSSPDRPRVTTPSSRGNNSRSGSTGRSSATVDRTPSRSGPASISSPDRSLSTDNNIRRPRVITSTPDRTSPQRSAPRVIESPRGRSSDTRSVQAPRRVEAPRQVQAPRSTVRQAPQRVESPRMEAPSRSASPRFERPTAPRRELSPPASSRNIERAAPSVRPSAPARQAPRIQRSAPQVSRPSAPAPSRQAAPSGRGGGGGGRGGGGREVRGR